MTGTYSGDAEPIALEGVGKSNNGLKLSCMKNSGHTSGFEDPRIHHPIQQVGFCSICTSCPSLVFFEVF